MDLVGSIGLYVGIIIITVSGLFQLAIRELGWPTFLVNHFREQRRAEVREVVQELVLSQEAAQREVIRGVVEAFVSEQDRVKASERAARAAAIQEAGRYADPKRRAEALIAGVLPVINRPMKRFAAEVPFWIDFMSASTDPQFADECGLILASYLRQHRADVEPFDAIIGLKGGSPIIAYSLAQRLRLPLLLFRGRSQPRRDTAEVDFREVFDGDKENLSSRVIIVDDSTTGGRMVLESTELIRRAGGTVVGVLVVFEVLGREGRQELEKNGISLHAVTTMGPEQVALLRETRSQ